MRRARSPSPASTTTWPHPPRWNGPRLRRCLLIKRGSCASSIWQTLTINGMHGGYAGPGSKTVLPHQAFVKCDIRLVANQNVDEIAAKVAAHVAQHAPEVELR